MPGATAAVCRARHGVHNDASEFFPISSALPELEEEFTIPSVPDKIELKGSRRLVAIGDVHGDMSKLRRSLHIAGVLDPGSSRDNPRWSGGDTVCVQCGDVLDRGDQELDCWRLLADLARQAESEGGTFAFLLGNHEAMNFEGMFHYAWADANDDFEREIGSSLDEALGTDKWREPYDGNLPARWAALEPGGIFAKALLSKMKVAMVVGRTLLVHGGITRPHLGYYGGIEAMNTTSQKWIMEQQDIREELESFAPGGKPYIDAQSRANVISRSMPKCLGGSSPLWIRLYSHPSDSQPRNPVAQGMLDFVLSETGADRMVMGHTPQNQINSALQGRVWRIDVGMSKGMMNGTPEVLEIVSPGCAGGQDEIWVLTESGQRIAAW
eukprot:CAMPEP_0113567350 /NCGR_PEP_ID=MMETSP0015_2-20120614/23229_1 /TAXON_ID=2838 /ORGANISM="Odontella" /LENGTH=381 /DNA_ID=CAMNT_0000469739 /DNA_START=123 /DNA_END=1265 /DNA_ORIENTATION=+ /assembly_acc=CAM_ASM_000160